MQIEDTKFTNRFLKKEFGITSTQEFLVWLNSLPENFFKDSFFLEKDEYIKSLEKLIDDINSNGYPISDAMEASKSGSIIESFASMALGEMMSQYKKDRKVLRLQINNTLSLVPKKYLRKLIGQN